MTRISSVTTAQDSWRPKDTRYPGMKSIPAVMASASHRPTPAGHPPAEGSPRAGGNRTTVTPAPSQTAGIRTTDISASIQAEGSRATVTSAPSVANKFETVTAPMKFPVMWKGPFHRPKKQGFNDDVCLETYEPATLSFADKQRKGIHEAFDGCSSMKDHIRRAASQPFPLASETPIPEETRTAAKFVAENDPHLVADFWGSQLTSLQKLVESAASDQTKWNKCIDPAISPAAGKINTLALRHLADFCGLGASKWMGQFAVGFPITGDLSQAKVFPRKAPKERLLPKKRLFESAEARFRERAPKSG